MPTPHERSEATVLRGQMFAAARSRLPCCRRGRSGRTTRSRREEEAAQRRRRVRAAAKIARRRSSCSRSTRAAYIGRKETNSHGNAHLPVAVDRRSVAFDSRVTDRDTDSRHLEPPATPVVRATLQLLRQQTAARARAARARALDHALGAPCVGGGGRQHAAAPDHPHPPRRVDGQRRPHRILADARLARRADAEGPRAGAACRRGAARAQHHRRAALRLLVAVHAVPADACGGAEGAGIDKAASPSTARSRGCASRTGQLPGPGERGAGEGGARASAASSTASPTARAAPTSTTA